MNEGRLCLRYPGVRGKRRSVAGREVPEEASLRAQRRTVACGTARTRIQRL